MENPHQREVALFEATLQLPPERREAYLDQACGGDLELRRRVGSLLKAHQNETDLIEPTAATLGSSFPREVLPTEKPGDRIGRYKLLQQIGEGGCGVVYMAEQEEPIRRRVALKVIKLGMDTKSVIGRFEAERQALALMDHPNIAKVLDAGATETGRPFFVMELVRGTKITDYCDQNNLSTQERLDLFIQVCHAVQHAHQKGVIHRDLKPSNILVTVNDGVAVPKVIDFGIAKATQGRLTDQTVFTAFEQFIGTPAYMSPEQAVLTSVDIDTRSDIYSLGVLLYELLTGRTPFDQKELLAAGLDEMRRTIREKEPSKPSTRLTQELVAADVRRLHSKSDVRDPKSEEEVRASSRRLLRVKELIHVLRGDLDWIVMKCLEKDRARRYETASGLARDIQRHLNCEPVTACPPSRWYEFQKTVRRHKFGFAAATAIIIVLAAGVFVSAGEAIRARRAEQEQIRLRQLSQANEQKARENGQKALTEAAKSQQVAQFLKDMLQGVRPSVAAGKDTALVKEILDKAYVRISTELTNQPEVEVELLNTIGSVYMDIVLINHAEQMHRQALGIARRFLGNDSLAAAEAMEGIARTMNNGNGPGAAERESLWRECLRIRVKLLGPDHPDVANALDGLSWSVEQAGNVADAESMAREALRIQRKALGETNMMVVTSLRCLGVALLDQCKLDESENLVRETIAITKALGNESKLAGALNQLAAILDERAWLLNRVPGQEGATEAKYSQAEATFREALELDWRFNAQYSVPWSEINNLSLLLHSQGKLKATDEFFNDALQRAQSNTNELNAILGIWSSFPIREGRFADAVTNLIRAVEINPDAWGSTWNQLIGTLAISGDFGAYTNYCRQMLDRFRNSTDPYCLGRTANDCLLLPCSDSQIEAASALAAETVAVAAKNRLTNEFVFAPQALADYRRGRFAEAVEWIRQHPVREREAGSRSYPYAMGADVEMEAVLAMANQRLGQAGEARAALADATERARLNLPDPGDWRFTTGDYQDWLAAHVLLREARRAVEGRTASNEYGDLVGYLTDSAMFAAKRGALPEAEILSREAVALCASSSDDPDPWLACALYRLSVVLELERKLPEAQQMAERGQAIKNSLLSSDGGDAAGLNALAWLLAASNDPQIRDGVDAVTFAERAVTAIKPKDPLFLNTLAAAYAEVGQFTNAINTEKEAIDLLTIHFYMFADHFYIQDYSTRLNLYQTNTPYREPQP